ncbi:tyrosinase-like [Ambystoma mexicanum]|uniref:tyrosinase-like n=1 Tax=Ambystoma mexicanum TaxID=8296 RepID=UPI0037E7B53C
MLPTLLLLSLCLSGVLSLFPKACTTEEALKERCCCPRAQDGSMCGAASRRGRCKFMHAAPHTHRKSYRQQNDDRLDWPREFYDSVCVCSGNYDGADCGDCKFGYTGERCETKKMTVRKEVRELSRPELLKFFSYLSLAKMKVSARYHIMTASNRHERSTFRFHEASVYDVFAWAHYYSFQPLLQNDEFNLTTNFAHEGPAFPPWHRWYLLFLEREMQILTKDPDFFIPYYDWSRDNSTCTICTNPIMGASDSQGVLTSSSYFASWKSICSGFNYIDKYCPVAEEPCRMEPLHRNPGADPSNNRLSSFQDVEDALKWKDFDTPPFNISAKRSFRNCLEGFMDPTNGVVRRRSMHNLFHMFMGGTMSQVPLSSNDPIFLMHHAFIDKILELWMEKTNATSETYPQNNIFGHGPEDNIVPSMPPVRIKDYFQSTKVFGYTYSNYTPHANGSPNSQY